MRRHCQFPCLPWYVSPPSASSCLALPPTDSVHLPPHPASPPRALSSAAAASGPVLHTPGPCQFDPGSMRRHQHTVHVMTINIRVCFMCLINQPQRSCHPIFLFQLQMVTRLQVSLKQKVFFSLETGIACSQSGHRSMHLSATHTAHSLTLPAVELSRLPVHPKPPA